ncbi:MAG: DinB family protein [Phaeodactylibacter sp.]|uniref:DinB family protein n=1 Tax=Phaeodactylibacter sp. TaxID=1940289 RepID=UPI0032F0948B
MNLSQAAAQILRQAERYLPHLTPRQYTEQPPLLQDSSIGQHTRHYIEFFECLIAQSQQPGGEIDYSKRQRSPEVETHPGQALKRIDHICDQLQQLEQARPLQLQCRDLQQTQVPFTVATNLERELVYNIEHTIHHLAIIKIGLAIVAPNLKLPEAFGTAPSTVAHRASR